MPMLPKLTTTLTPMQTEEPKPRATLTIYLAGAHQSSTLAEYDAWPTCDKCGQALEDGVEYPVDEKGARHRGRCPKPKGKDEAS